MSCFKSRVSCTFFQLVFLIKKHYCLLSFVFFLCQLCNQKVCLFQCVVANFYHRDHKLIVHVRRGIGNYHLILDNLGIFQVPLDVQSLKKICAFIFRLT